MPGPKKDGIAGGGSGGKQNGSSDRFSGGIAFLTVVLIQETEVLFAPIRPSPKIDSEMSESYSPGSPMRMTLSMVVLKSPAAVAPGTSSPPTSDSLV